MGSPKQEYWIRDNIEKLHSVKLAVAEGGSLDFLAGDFKRAPRWMINLGLEWLFRLGTEPRRLWPRYREYPLFLILLAGQMLGLRHYTLDA